MDANRLEIIDAVNRAHACLVDVFNNSASAVKNVTIADDCDDIFLWVREDGKALSPWSTNITGDVELYETNVPQLITLQFQLFVENRESDYTMECEYSVDIHNVRTKIYMYCNPENCLR